MIEICANIIWKFTEKWRFQESSKTMSKQSQGFIYTSSGRFFFFFRFVIDIEKFLVCRITSVIFFTSKRKKCHEIQHDCFHHFYRKLLTILSLKQRNIKNFEIQCHNEDFPVYCLKIMCVSFNINSYEIIEVIS